MSAPAAVELVQNSKIGSELIEEQSQVLAQLVEINEYVNGDVVVEEGASDDKLSVVLAAALAVAKRDGDDWVRLNVLTAVLPVSWPFSIRARGMRRCLRWGRRKSSASSVQNSNRCSTAILSLSIASCAALPASRTRSRIGPARK
jgi:hypothetical protein